MQTFQVQLWAEGKWDGKPYQKVDAETAKEAAEKLCGRPLSETGSNYQIRARVHHMLRPRGDAAIFYET
jgi:hypothetical protein